MTEQHNNEKNWLRDLRKLISAGVSSIVMLAGAVLKGKATPGQNIFFTSGVLGIVTLVLGGLIAFLGDANLLIWVLLVLAVEGIVLMLSMSSIMRLQSPTAQAESDRDIQIRRLLEERGTLIEERDTLKEKHSRIQDELDQTKHDLAVFKKAHVESSMACTKIHQHLTMKPHYPAVLDEVITFVIDKDGTLKGSRETRFQTADRAQQMLIHLFVGDTPVSSIWDLGIEVDGDGKHEVVILSARDMPSIKEALLFFIPEIPPKTETGKFLLSWTWPKLWNPLVDYGVDRWSETVRSTARVPRMLFRFKLHPDLGRVKLENTKHGGGKAIIPNKMTDEHGFREFLWEMTDVEPGTELEIMLTVL